MPHPPPYIHVVEDLTRDQQAIYLEAFRSADNLDLIEWYGRFRLNGVLRSVILFTNRCDLASLAEEAEALARLGSAQDGCGWLGRATADLIRFIAALDRSRRPEFLSRLAKRFRRGGGRGGNASDLYYAVMMPAWELAEKFGGRIVERRVGDWHETWLVAPSAWSPANPGDEFDARRSRLP